MLEKYESDEGGEEMRGMMMGQIREMGRKCRRKEGS
jgi:hypothetical protein